MSAKEEVAVEGAEAADTDDTELSEQQLQTFKETFSKMGALPKVRTKGELSQWMAHCAETLGLLPDPTTSSPPPSTSAPAAATASPSPLISSPVNTMTATSFSITEPVVHAQPTLASVVASRKPWLIKFSGQTSEGYTLWRHQLQSLRKEGHSSASLADAIRSSLQGKAGDAAARLGTEASVAMLLKKMDSIYGEVDAEEDLLHIFYGSRQTTTESVSEWGCRLEATLDLLKKQGPLPRSENHMLRTMLWKGLRKDLQDLSGYKYDRIEDFDELRVVLRRIEKQQPPSGNTIREPRKSTPAKAAQVNDDELHIAIKKLTAEVASLKAAQTSNSTRPHQGTSNLTRMPHSARDGGREGFQKSNNNNGNNMWFPRKNPAPLDSHEHPRQRQQSQYQLRSRDELPACYRCGQQGHIAIGCRVRLDHVRRPQDF